MVVAGGISLIGMILLGLIVAFIAAAIVGAGRVPRALAWVGAVGILMLAVLFGVRFLRGPNQLRELQARQEAVARMDEVRSMAMTTHGSEMTSGSIATPHGQAMVWSQGHTTRSSGVLFVALLVPFVVFLVLRLAARSRGEGVDGSRSRSGWSWLAAGAACFVIVGGIWGARSTHYSVQRGYTVEPARSGNRYSQDVPARIGNRYSRNVIEQQGTIASHEPLDELWERLNASQIPVSTSTTSDLAKAEVNQDEEADQDHGASRAPVDDPFGTFGLGETASKSERLERLYKKVSDDDAPQDDHFETAPAETKFVDAPPFTGSEAKTIPPPRPDWVAQPPRMVGGVQRVVLQAGPYTSLEECYTQLRTELREAVADHIGDLVREATANASPYVPELASMGITDGYIIRELLTDQFVEDVEASFGLTKTAWGLVEFTETQDLHLLNAWRNYARRDRVKYTIALAVAAVSVLGGIFALLKIDTWTRGYYTKRLFLGVPAAIIGLMILAGLVGV
jgi:hypothetical protein